MAAKIKINENEFVIDQGGWSCKENPEMAEFFQKFCNDHFNNSTDYLVDIDEQSAKLILSHIKGELIKLDPPAPAPAGIIF